MEQIPYGYYRGSLPLVAADVRIPRSRLIVTKCQLNRIRTMPSFQ